MTFDEHKHPRDDGGKFTNKGETAPTDKTVEELRTELIKELPDKPKAEIKKMTPEEKIASVHIETGKDNILPELNEEDLSKIGINKNKPVLVKASIIERNAIEHSDVKSEDVNRLISEPLYSPDYIEKGRNPNAAYFSLAKKMRLSKKDGKPVYGVVLLDVDAGKENFEVVHWHWVKQQKLKSIK